MVNCIICNKKNIKEKYPFRKGYRCSLCTKRNVCGKKYFCKIVEATTWCTREYPCPKCFKEA